MNEQKLYRYDGKLYRAELNERMTCKGCAFNITGIRKGCYPLGVGASCGSRKVVAKLVPPTLPVPASVTIVELNS